MDAWSRLGERASRWAIRGVDAVLRRFSGIFEFDAQTQTAVDYRCKLNGTKSDYEPVTRDKDEKFVYEMIVDLSKLEPTVACHPDPGQRKKAKEMGADSLVDIRPGAGSGVHPGELR